MLESGGFLSVLSISDHLSQQRVKIPTTYGKDPTRSAGWCPLAGGRGSDPGLYPANYSTLLDQPDVVLKAALGEDCSVLCTDEPPYFNLQHSKCAVISTL